MSYESGMIILFFDLFIAFYFIIHLELKEREKRKRTHEA